MPITFEGELDLLGATHSESWNIRLDVLHHMKNMIILVRQRKICFINAAGLAWLGLTSTDDILGEDIRDIFSGDYGDLVEMGLEVLAEETMIPLKLTRHDGTEIDVEMWVDKMGVPADEIFIVEARNITEHLRAARALRSREQWLEGIINTVADGIVTVDHRGIVQSFNPAAERIFRFKSNEIIGRNIRELVPTPIADRVSGENGIEWQRLTLLGNDLMGRRKDGVVFPMEMSVREMLQGESVSYTGVVRDITARRRAEERIRHLAQHDPLTNLPNRFLFGDRLDAAIQRATRHHKRLAVVFIDLNAFKPINDTHGHSTGDKVLVGVSDRLRHCLRKTDTVARVGGDEFVAILEEVAGEEQVRSLAGKIMTAVTQPLVIDGVSLQVTASLGVSTFPDDSSDPDQLVDFADKAMYQAKQKGPRYVCMYPRELWQDSTLQ